MESGRSKLHHFFKIILSDNIESQLMIPKKFVRKYGNSLPDRVFLKTPAGVSWAVDLGRSGNQVWLRNGWPEFAKHHALCYGHFLLFGYEKSTTEFRVVICDKTASEIDYPLCANAKNHNQQKPTTPAHKIKTAKCSGDSNKTKDSPKVKEEDKDSSYASAEEVTKGKISKSKRVTKGKGGKSLKRYLSETTAWAEAFSSENPFIRVKLYPSCLVRSGLTIPKSFAEKHITLDSGNVTLQVDGKSWPVRCILYPKVAYFGSGWTAFALDNNLKAGQNCIFELIDSEKKLLNVVVSPAEKIASC